jgi:hypothetical protein
MQWSGVLDAQPRRRAHPPSRRGPLANTVHALLGNLGGVNRFWHILFELLHDIDRQSGSNVFGSPAGPTASLAAGATYYISMGTGTVSGRRLGRLSMALSAPRVCFLATRVSVAEKGTAEISEPIEISQVTDVEPTDVEYTDIIDHSPSDHIRTR